MANTTQGAVAQEQALVPTFRATIGGIEQTCVDARTLHAYLQNGDLYANWINARLQKYRFEEGADYEPIALEKTKAKNPGRGGHNKKDYRLTLDMAKELSMVENNDRGREARRYFIAMERKALGMSQAPAARQEAQPQRPVNAAREQLNAADMQNLKRLIWMVADRMRNKEVWSQAIWKYLREALNHPTPHPFCVDQLPSLQQEMASVLSVGLQVQGILSRIEQDAARRIFRRGEVASVVLPALEAQAQKDMQRLIGGLSGDYSWIEGDLRKLLSREQPYMGVQYRADEQPDFFLSAA